jgi:hypothetical protein
MNQKEKEYEIYLDILNFACTTQNLSLIKLSLPINKNLIPHNSFFKISCCKKNSDISNFFLEEEYLIEADHEILEYASIVNCNKLLDNVLNFYKIQHYSPNLRKGVIQSLKNNSTIWMQYYIENSFDFNSLNNIELLSILNVCNYNTCHFLFKNIKKEKKTLKLISNKMINKSNEKIVLKYLSIMDF